MEKSVERFYSGMATLALDRGGGVFKRDWEAFYMKELYTQLCADYGWTPSTKGFICFCSLATLRKLWAKKMKGV